MPLMPGPDAGGVDGPASCDYSHTYSDMRTGIARDYQCPRPRHGGGRSCIFHAADGADPEDVRKAFAAELESDPGQDKGDPLLFVGCRMPSIYVEGLSTARSVYFTDAKFAGDVELANVDCGAIDFTDAGFAGHLEMTSASAKILRLRKARLGPRHGTPLSGAGGGDRAAIDLHGCSFESCDMALSSAPSVRLSGCDFAHAQLRGSRIEDLSVRECKFGSSTDFAACRLGRSQFDTVTFGGPATFEGASFERESRFTRAHFLQQDLVRFCRTLSNVSFIGTNMTKIRFDADTVWSDDGSYAILDERSLAGSPSKSSLSDTLAVYRSLLECHEYWLTYEEAGRFYVREMDMRRCYRDAPGGGAARRRVRRYVSLANGYNVLCRYGESFGRASAWVRACLPPPRSTTARLRIPRRLARRPACPRGLPARTSARWRPSCTRGGAASTTILSGLHRCPRPDPCPVIKRRLGRRFRH